MATILRAARSAIVVAIVDVVVFIDVVTVVVVVHEVVAASFLGAGVKTALALPPIKRLAAIQRALAANVPHADMGAAPLSA